jgi:hypothetical protein
VPLLSLLLVSANSDTVSGCQLGISAHGYGGLTCLCDCDDLVVVAVACSLEVLWELSGLATTGLAHYDGDRVVFDGVEQCILVAGYGQQRARLV